MSHYEQLINELTELGKTWREPIQKNTITMVTSLNESLAV